MLQISQNYQKVFKAYDIRGKYGEEIDEKMTYILGIAIAKYLKNNTENQTMLIGSDIRLANTSLITAFIAGLQSEGIQKIFCAKANDDTDFGKYPYGICSTSGLYYLGQNDVDLAVAFTASHNPPEDVGMKFFDKTCTFLSQQTLLDMFNANYDEARKLPDLPNHYELEQFPVLQEKKNKLLNFLQSKYSQLQNMCSIGVDFSTGSGVALEKELLQKLIPNDKLTLINDYPDGMFPAHLSETQEHHNYQQLIQTLKAKNLDFGIMFDGDADRIGFVGADGKVVGGDMILAIVAEQILKEIGEQASKPLILYEVMCSKRIAELVEQAGGTSKMVRMGRFFIKQAMEETGSVFAGETSGHFMFASIGGYEMPLLALYYVLKAVQQYGSRTSMINQVSKYPKTPVNSVVVQDKQLAISAIKNHFSSYKQMEIDGISIYGNDFWFNVRSSNTENKIRYCVEADTAERLENIQKELEKLIK